MFGGSGSRGCDAGDSDGKEDHPCLRQWRTERPCLARTLLGRSLGTRTATHSSPHAHIQALRAQIHKYAHTRTPKYTCTHTSTYAHTRMISTRVASRPRPPRWLQIAASPGISAQPPPRTPGVPCLTPRAPGDARCKPQAAVGGASAVESRARVCPKSGKTKRIERKSGCPQGGR